MLEGLGGEAILGMLLGASLVTYFWSSGKRGEAELPQKVHQRDFQLDELERYDGADGRLLYVAVKGEVFDVGAVNSGRKRFSKAGDFAACAGRDASRCLALGQSVAMARDVERAGDLEDLRLEHLQHLDACLDEFRTAYTRVGRLIRPREFSLEELAHFDGKEGRPIYLSAKDEVFDVTRGSDFYGEDGGYHIMAGRDASRALALMSLDVKDVDNRRLDDLSPGDLSILDEWVDKFHFKYTLMGRLTTPRPTAESGGPKG